MALRVLSLLYINRTFTRYGLTKRFFANTNKETEQDSEIIVRKIKTDLVSKEEKLAREARKEAVIIVSDAEDVGICSGVPEEHIKSRTVRIYCPAKNAMQSGTNNINHWQIDFDTRERWENPLMGWTSTGDPLSNLHVTFATKEEAIAHCNKMRWKYYIQNPNINNPKPRSYGTNFSWNKRTRVSTK
ncbi:NADH dehydrogenase [ubiquinone] iron-sulfur protein 4, mitochondrial [Apis mellifera caucasica]|uniref:NADH dehydrogenase [ubiquinone] iron-sulfur protein 4, mitochondrial n=1 Tax=Apis mellifera TaxID=7460 RepID=A0A7M7G3F2_APIME|nr:NADH dehydrogenase [ubiquinone] iron-sulfur protein 4, mitochondrial [Apis mellifera]KAG6804581.1 NADH dehydrogenase [ubiquinone] iron-sulfur protein 4, mitochondrial [Apis mellifera caucasica]KAG9431395.1 NADH dehydrogenase [ubiquinone] iron-sulfur protein 4, mitochondrial [Apis mellifera carnica]|eukprot:XP_001123307.2 NADH dehydrogenase [ubiquinone] iron-sulfur protein 4, mitochondrial [Apis mellifera]